MVTPRAGDWLHASSLTAVGIRLSDEAIRVAIGYRLETTICQLHTCACGATVDARRLHEMVCRKSGPHHIRHSQLNDLIWRTVENAPIPASKEPSDYRELMVKDPTKRLWSRGLVANRSLGM